MRKYRGKQEANEYEIVQLKSQLTKCAYQPTSKSSSALLKYLQRKAVCAVGPSVKRSWEFHTENKIVSSSAENFDYTLALQWIQMLENF